ncbi:hypothetical protein [Echinicola pacifica]|uniref:hypothetical protein n=1 Tax=Echinicola pacifica TaxID=346377 RepID=UPI00036EBFE9|nr:hypothetical protein [Echinicola pacifica]
MIDTLLKIEKSAKMALRYLIVLFWAVILIKSLFFAGTAQEHFVMENALWSIAGLITGILLLFHLSQPRLAIIGGVASALYTFILSIIAFLSPPMALLNGLFWLIFCTSSIILTGESLKEMIKKRITKPFPKR